MDACFFVSDLHGSAGRYRKLFAAILDEAPAAVFLGGDLLPNPFGGVGEEAFIRGVLAAGFEDVHRRLGERAPRVFLIPGNDDPRSAAPLLAQGEAQGLWECMHMRRVEFGAFSIYGYACVPPTPFLMKDWERYDVSRFVDVGCVSPEEGMRTVEADESDVQFGSIRGDLALLAGEASLSNAVFLLHAPPYDCGLDRAALDGRRVDGVELDVHVGSIAVRRFIEERQPLLTLHGHVHESARLTGRWMERIGRTLCLGAATDDPRLCLVRFTLQQPGEASRGFL